MNKWAIWAWIIWGFIVLIKFIIVLPNISDPIAQGELMGTAALWGLVILLIAMAVRRRLRKNKK